MNLREAEFLNSNNLDPLTFWTRCSLSWGLSCVLQCYRMLSTSGLYPVALLLPPHPVSGQPKVLTGIPGVGSQLGYKFTQ